MLIGPSTALTIAIRRAGEEAALCGDRRIGTDHLLLGLLHDDDVVAVVGADVHRGRAAARELDQTALSAIGLRLGDLPAAVQTQAPTRATVSRMPLTSAAREAISRAGALADAEGRRRIEPLHLAAALRERAQPDPAAVLLAAIGPAGDDASGRPAH